MRFANLSTTRAASNSNLEAKNIKCKTINTDNLTTNNLTTNKIQSDTIKINGGYIENGVSIVSEATAKNNLEELITISNTGSNWHGVTWSPELGIFVAVARNAGFGVSRDGFNWDTFTDVTDGQPNRVIWAKKKNSNDGIFVVGAIGTDQSTNAIATSPDGVNWTERDAKITTGVFDLAWSPELEIIVAVSSNAQNKETIIISRDFGETWNIVKTNLNEHFLGITWSSELGIFSAVSSQGGAAISRDGINWSEKSTTDALRHVVWSSQLGLFVAVAGEQGKKIQISRDGLNWNAVTTPTTIDGTIRFIEWSPELNMFVACSSGGTSTLMYSFDGKKWYDINTTISFRGLVWSPELGVFLFVTISQTVYMSSLKKRTPTSNNVFDNSFNSISNNGEWTFKTKELYNDENNILIDASGIDISSNELNIDTNVLDLSGDIITDTSGGTASGNFLQVRINGTNYKIQLLNET